MLLADRMTPASTSTSSASSTAASATTSTTTTMPTTSPTVALIEIVVAPVVIVSPAVVIAAVVEVLAMLGAGTRTAAGIARLARVGLVALSDVRSGLGPFSSSGWRIIRADSRTALSGRLRGRGRRFSGLVGPCFWRRSLQFGVAVRVRVAVGLLRRGLAL
jgi:hypothetical protein